nr:glycosyltransferase family 4 protein [Adlercreutzia sp. ZJ154]
MLSVEHFLRDSRLGKRFGLSIVATASKHHKLLSFILGFSQIKKLIRIGECDCVHIHMSENASVYRASIIIRWIKNHSRSRVIVHSHGGSVQYFFDRCSQKTRRFLLKSLELIDSLVVLTPGWEKWWRTLLPSLKISVIPNGVNVPFLDVAKKENANVVLFLGQICEAKGVYCLLDAVQGVIERFPEVNFVFAGDGEIQKCLAYAETLGIKENCVFVGWVGKHEKEILLKRASVLVLPSKVESFGIVLLEAMAYAVPVICSDGGFMHEVVDDRQNGIVFSFGDSVQLACAICEIFEFPGCAVEMGISGRKKVEEVYSADKVLAQWERLYEGLLR